jgi:hypothetical protein
MVFLFSRDKKRKSVSLNENDSIFKKMQMVVQ